MRATPVPDPLFNSLLEEIEDLAELKVTLRLHLAAGAEAGPRSVLSQEKELLSRRNPVTRSLRKSRRRPGRSVFGQGLNLALTRGHGACAIRPMSLRIRRLLLPAEY